MFHIFTKKRFLVDTLHGFVDIHNHILPGIDDGAKTVKESIALLNGFSSFGVTKFIATPHIMNDYYPNTSETIDASLASLKNTLLDEGLTHIAIDAAAEHMIDSNFENLLATKGVMPLRSNHLLIEMSYLQESLNFEEALQKITSAGFFPILAHPERYRYLHHKRSKYKDYKKKGALFQLNLLSLGDYYGKDIQKMAESLLDHNLIDIIASDVHNINQLNSLKEIKLSRSMSDQVIPIIRNTISEFY